MRDGVKTLFYIIYNNYHFLICHRHTPLQTCPFKCIMITLLWTKILLYILWGSSPLLTDHVGCFRPIYLWSVLLACNTFFFYFKHSFKIGPWSCHIGIFFSNTVLSRSKYICPKRHRWYNHRRPFYNIIFVL